MSEHIVSKKIYFTIFFILLGFTGLTVGVAFIDLGRFNIVVALLIAATKAGLVITFFMHVKYSSRLTRLFALAGFFWLAIMMTLTLSDYMTRGWLNGIR